MERLVATYGVHVGITLPTSLFALDIDYVAFAERRVFGCIVEFAKGAFGDVEQRTERPIGVALFRHDIIDLVGAVYVVTAEGLYIDTVGIGVDEFLRRCRALALELARRFVARLGGYIRGITTAAVVLVQQIKVRILDDFD